MKNTSHALLVAFSMSVSAAAFAAGGGTPGAYVGAGYAGETVDFSGVSDSADVGVLFGRLGFQIDQNFAVEARLGFGIDDDHISGSKIEVEDMYGAYLKAGVPLQMGFYPYVIAGATHGKVKVSGSRWSESDSSSDISYGLGVDYWFNSQTSAGLEYMKLYDKDGVEVSGLTLGVNFKF